MRYAILVTCSPQRRAASDTAYRFAAAALMMGQEIVRVFFHGEGIYHALATLTPPVEEPDPVRRWGELAERYALDLVVCVAAAQRRGLLMPEENRRRHYRDSLIAPGFRIAGLSQWVEAVQRAERVVVF